MKNLHVTLILEDDSIATKSVQMDQHDSVAKAMHDIAKDDYIAKRLPNLKKAIRVYGGKVFVDDREQALWMLGQAPSRPRGGSHTTVVN